MTTNRPNLMTLLGHHFTVTNPRVGTSWSGKLVALCDDPSLIIDQDNGTRIALPQHFTVTKLDTPPTSGRIDTPKALLTISVEESRDGEIKAALESLASLERINRTIAANAGDVVEALRLAGYKVVRPVKAGHL